MLDLLVIIPAYNESASIESLLRRIHEVVPHADVVVVDDGSRDDTARRVRAAGHRVLQHPLNLGYGAALQTGYLWAREKGYRQIVQLDADGQHDPSSIPRLLAALEDPEVDVVVGSRFLEGLPYEAGRMRRLGMSLFGGIASFLTGRTITDPTSGYQAFRASVLPLLTSPLFPCDYPDADVLVMLHFHGFRIREVPVRMAHRAEGESMHSGLKPLYYVYKMFLSLGMTLLREKPEDLRRVIRRHASQTEDPGSVGQPLGSPGHRRAGPPTEAA